MIEYSIKKSKKLYKPKVDSPTNYNKRKINPSLIKKVTILEIKLLKPLFK